MFKAEPVLSTLKDFQRRTVDHVFERLYGENSTRRFLVADEVGLGKTMIAKGIIARAIEYLEQHGIQRIDIIYICSNASIASQNIARLVTMPEVQAMHHATRITMLPLTIDRLANSHINFIALTPDTSFNVNRSSGMSMERALICMMASHAWGTPIDHYTREIFRVWRSAKYFQMDIDYVAARIHADNLFLARFLTALEAYPELRHEFRFLRGKTDMLGETAVRERHLRFIGSLRHLLAQSNLKSLEPDLIILDEFQRFTHLLREDSNEAMLARDLFNYEDEQSKARVLLLSATPYKMYTLANEGDDNHYGDFIQTMRFLNREDDAAQQELTHTLKDYSDKLGTLGQIPLELVSQARVRLETSLRRVMVRTERLAVSQDRNGMLTTISTNTVRLNAGDLTSYVALSALARQLNDSDPLEYWKSSPYLLSFMEEYKFKQKFKALADAQGEPLLSHLSQVTGISLTQADINRYQSIDPRNARLRELFAQVIDNDMWQLLWLPPALPYYQMAGVYQRADSRKLTKRLIFSSWQVVPKMIALLTSYEVERRIYDGSGIYNERSTSPLLRFGVDNQSGRMTGMPVLAWLYPSSYLARLCDPLPYASQPVPFEMLLETLTEKVQAALMPLLDEIGAQERPAGDTMVDEAWYWFAPLVLDTLESGTIAWWGQKNDDPFGRLSAQDKDRVPDSRLEHYRLAREFLANWRSRPELKTYPSDLFRIVALYGLAGAGNVLLRSLQHLPGIDFNDARNAAASIALTFISFFNDPQVTRLIQREPPYWQNVLLYSAQGCLQAVTDEYIHLLKESLGLAGQVTLPKLQALVQEFKDVLTLRTPTYNVDEVQTTQVSNFKMRAHFALRFGANERTDDGLGSTQMRSDLVRKAFNSPFYPFVLASTSIGQEGLDFHSYCHAIIHWNLPSNPVDMEQREGRVHRYKGHAVRKNIAHAWGNIALESDLQTKHIWEALFKLAADKTPDRQNELIPFWIYPGDAKIERHLPFIPLSRDYERFENLVRALALYRMAFGQSRQDELVSFLRSHITDENLPAISDSVMINLSP